jgi:predicted peptidase
MRLLSGLFLLVGSLHGCGGAEPTTSSPFTGTPAEPVVTPTLGFVKRSVTVDGVVFPYQVFAPQNFVGTRKWPIVVALAGTEERGNDNEKQVNVGLAPFVRTRAADFPAVVIFPQIPSDAAASNIFDQAAFRQLDEVIRAYNGDPERIYLTGLSFGGTAGFSLLYHTPGRFAAFLAIAPGLCPRCISNGSTLREAELLVASKLKSVPVWIHMGDQDVATAVAANRELVADFKAAGSTSIRYTEYAGMGHVIWDMVYTTPSVWDWLFAQRL